LKKRSKEKAPVIQDKLVIKMSDKLQIKVCGMREPENIREISLLEPDYMGFIYYFHSKRYAGALTPAQTNSIPDKVKKVGVFVNLPEKTLLSKCSEMEFNFVQLHGNESVKYCRFLNKEGFRVIKAFGLGSIYDFEQMKPYQESCEFFLFDTFSPGYGGSGKKFDWNLLCDYRLEKPFMLSGGVTASDIDRILVLDHPEFLGVDLNSGFEIQPGIKDRKLLEGFIQRIRS